MFRKVALLYIAAMAPICLFGQSYTASIRGIVTDSSKSAVPEARVTVTETARNTSQTAITDSAGRYVVTALPPGQYTLSVEAQGFNKYTQAN
jgi:hypothetical protein